MPQDLPTLTGTNDDDQFVTHPVIDASYNSLEATADYGPRDYDEDLSFKDEYYDCIDVDVAEPHPQYGLFYFNGGWFSPNSLFRYVTFELNKHLSHYQTLLRVGPWPPELAPFVMKCPRTKVKIRFPSFVIDPSTLVHSVEPRIVFAENDAVGWSNVIAEHGLRLMQEVDHFRRWTVAEQADFQGRSASDQIMSSYNSRQDHQTSESAVAIDERSCERAVTMAERFGATAPWP